MTIDPNPFAGPRSKTFDLSKDVAGAGADDERIRREHLVAETRIRSVSLLYVLGGATGALGVGTVVVVFVVGLLGGDRARSIGVGEVIIVGLGMGGVYAVILATGMAMRRFQSWARWSAVVWAGLGLLAFPLGTLVSSLV